MYDKNTSTFLLFIKCSRAFGSNIKHLLRPCTFYQIYETGKANLEHTLKHKFRFFLHKLLWKQGKCKENINITFRAPIILLAAHCCP